MHPAVVRVGVLRLVIHGGEGIQAKARPILPLEGAGARRWSSKFWWTRRKSARRKRWPTPPSPFLVAVVDVHRVDVVGIGKILRLVMLRFRLPILILQSLLTGLNRASKRGSARKRQLSNLIVRSFQRSITLASVRNSVVLN